MAPPRLRATTDDLPALELLTVSQPTPPPPPPPRLSAVPTPARPLDRLARIGLAVSVVLALVGMVGVAVKSGDDDAPTRTDTAGVVIHKPTPDTTADDEPAPTDVAVPDGFELITGDGISMAAPESWIVLDPDDLSLRPEDFEDIYPDADGDVLENAARAFEQGAVLLAADLGGADAGHNLNVLTMPLAVPVSEMEELFIGELESAGIHVVDSGTIDHPMGPAYRVTITSPVDGVDIEAAQYYLPYDGSTYIVTITGPTGEACDQMFETFRVDSSGPV